MFRACGFPWTYVESSLSGRLSRDYFKDVKSFALFIGHRCPATELIHSLLNADPRISLGCGPSGMQYVRYGYKRNQLLWLIQSSVSRPDFSVRVLPTVIGDANASKSMHVLKRSPNAVKILRHRLGLPIRFVYVVSDPFNAISAIHQRSTFAPLKSVANKYLQRCETTSRLIESSDDVLTVHMEDVAESPELWLPKIVRHLGLEPHHAHINTCAEFVRDHRPMTSDTNTWPIEVVDLVTQRIDQYRFLRRYSELQPTGLAKAA